MCWKKKQEIFYKKKKNQKKKEEADEVSICSPGIRATPRNTASCTALIPIPSTFLPPSKLVGPNGLGGLEHGRLAYLDGKTPLGRVLGCNNNNKNK